MIGSFGTWNEKQNLTLRAKALRRSTITSRRRMFDQKVDFFNVSVCNICSRCIFFVLMWGKCHQVCFRLETTKIWICRCYNSKYLHYTCTAYALKTSRWKYPGHIEKLTQLRSNVLLLTRFTFCIGKFGVNRPW